MDFKEIKLSYSKLLPFAQDWGLSWLLIVAVIVLLIWLIYSGKIFSFKIPFLPKAISRVSLSKDALSAAKDSLFTKADAPTTAKYDASAPSVIDKLTNALALLSGGRNKRYDTPLYLMLGDDKINQQMLTDIGSGERERLILQQHKIIHNKHWFIFNGACVLTHPQPHKISQELTQYRPERPLDGIILCLPADTLYHASAAELEQLADQLYQQLWQIQHELQFVLPVYVLLNQAQHLPGFSEYWMQAGLRPFLNNICGWSVPYNEHQAYNQGYLDEALDYLQAKLREIQLAQFSKQDSAKQDSAKQDTPAEQALLLPATLGKLLPAAGLICHTLFSPSHFHHALMFRGIYFSAQLPDNDGVKHCFLEDLFEQKIFNEANLAYPPKTKLLSSNRHLRLFQYASASALIVLAICFGIDISKLNKQQQNLVDTITAVSQLSEGTGIKDVNQVIEQVSDMDASKLFFPTIIKSWPWFNAFNSHLIDYFDKNVFSSRVFPAFECRSAQQILQLSNSLRQNSSVISPQEFDSWLAEMASHLRNQAQLHKLINGVGFSKSEVVKDFTAIVDHLYQEKLPESFHQHSELYVDAISGRRNVVAKTSSLCPDAELNDSQVWALIQDNALQQLPQISKQVAAPQEFFKQLQALQSLSGSMDWQQNNFAQLHNQYTSWLENMRQEWLGIETRPRLCKRLATTLNNIAQGLAQLASPQVAAYEQACLAQATGQMQLDKLNGDTPLYEFSGAADGEHQVANFTPAAEALIAELNKVDSLDFVYTSSAPHSEPGDNHFYWSVDLLNKAIQSFQQYQDFAQAQYQSLWLPKDPGQDALSNAKYQAQAVALKQLQLTMSKLISRARQDKQVLFEPATLRPVDQQEARLATRVANFRLAMDSLISLGRIFEQLGFDDTKSWFRELSQLHAFGILQQTEQLYAANRLYQPRPSPNWGSQQYLHALFGINNAQQLQDYLVSQGERADFIAVNYAQPVIIFLLNIQGKYINYHLLSRWQNSLVDIDKTKNNDGTSSRSQLEFYFNNQLIATDQSNCFKQTQGLDVPQKNDIFALSQAHIIKRAESLCNSYQADSIKQEYADVANWFTQLLANKYPFASPPQRAVVSPQALMQFMQHYSGQSSGLAKRMEVLAWKNQDYQQQRDFIKALDQSIDLFASILGSTQGAQAPGLELQVEYNVLPELANNTKHISQWTLQSGELLSQFPGDATNPLWYPNKPLSLSLKWAKNSPYQARALGGQTRTGRELYYGAKGLWSLLTFIDQHRASLPDPNALMSHSILLKFEASLTSPLDSQQKIANSKALMRLTVFAYDPQSKQKKALLLPVVFPSFAPPGEPNAL